MVCNPVMPNLPGINLFKIFRVLGTTLTDTQLIWLDCRKMVVPMLGTNGTLGLLRSYWVMLVRGQVFPRIERGSSTSSHTWDISPALLGVNFFLKIVHFSHVFSVYKGIYSDILHSLIGACWTNHASQGYCLLDLSVWPFVSALLFAICGTNAEQCSGDTPFVLGT